jgi:colanic acid biosynthesis glycosyl transferase WcaI
MKLLLVTDSYWPEIRSASQLMIDLASELRQRGHDVIVITAWPEYNIDRDFDIKSIEPDVLHNDIRVIRVKTLPLHNVGYLIRGIAQILLPVFFIYKLILLKIKVDAVIVYSPPLPLSFVGLWCKFYDAKFVLNLQDIFPQNAVDLGIMKNKLLVRFFMLMEKFCYFRCDWITAHSNGNVKLIQERFPNLSKKIILIHNWVDINLTDEGNNNIDFKERFKITRKYIAVFAGVMGPSQGLEIILKIAKALKYRQDLQFLFVGNGTEKKKMIELSKKYKLDNVQFEDFISTEYYQDLLKICSIGLVCLSPMNKTPVVPGKILGYMAASIPIAAFLQDESDGHQVVNEAACGVAASSSNEVDCIYKFEQLMSKVHEFEAIGKSGFKYASENFNRKMCIDKIEALLN